MQAMEIDPKTGYMQSPNGNSPRIFTGESKKKFLQLASDYIRKHNNYPPLHLLAEGIGVSLRTVQTHLSQDSAFKQDWKDVLNTLQVIFTQKLGDKAQKTQGTLANIAMLRYLESGTWSPSGLNPISHSAPSKEIISQFHEAIDAEIVPEPKQLPGKSEPVKPI